MSVSSDIHVRQIMTSMSWPEPNRAKWGRVQGGMTQESGKATMVKLPKSRALLVHAAAAVHAVSLKEGRQVSMREAAIAGFEHIIEDRRIDAAIALKFFTKYDFNGPRIVYVAFKEPEMVNLHECRKRLSALGGEPLDRVDAIIVALIRMGRPEFGHDQLMDVRNFDG